MQRRLALSLCTLGSVSGDGPRERSELPRSERSLTPVRPFTMVAAMTIRPARRTPALTHTITCALALAACGPASTPSATTESTTPAETTPAEPATTETAPTSDRTAEPAQIRALMAALGCPAGAQTDQGCQQCVALDEGLAPAPAEFEDGEPTITVVLGRFAPDAERAAMVTVEGCASRAAGDHQVYVLAQEGEAWRPLAQWGYNDGAECVFPRRADGREHILCAVFSGAQGCYDSRIESPGALPLELPIPVQPSADECAGLALELGVPSDLDGDGDDDVPFTLDGTPQTLVQTAPDRFTAEPAR